MNKIICLLVSLVTFVSVFFIETAAVSYIGEEMSIDSGQFVYLRSGNKVGIGTSAPFNNFTVSGDVRIRGVAMMNERSHPAIGTGLDWRYGNKLVLNVPANSNTPTLSLTIANPPPGPALLSLRINMNSDAVVRALSITGATVLWPLGTAPVLSGYNDVVYFFYDGSKYYGIRSFNR